MALAHYALERTIMTVAEVTIKFEVGNHPLTAG
jgi:hypothetical protein